MKSIDDASPRPRPLELLHERFGFEGFRPHQEEVCTSLIEGHDVLLVMPTGAGKSLCYQLPGIARGGTTLVISPLIALMEDQVAGLRETGLRAARIHSARPKEESRQVCLDYLAGALDFLFIAPERLSVPGFPQWLARRTPTLIAIDEAHCISQWGHDFRPDYRRLREHIPGLRPAPVIALTATATPRVQQDIREQLELRESQQFIHGFRRENLAIEVVELNPGARAETSLHLLSASNSRPAIVYAPTRKKAAALAEELAEHFPAAVYHAGLEAAQRDETHAAFLRGELEVVVATIAFGMGIDKADVRSVIHTAMPASIEGYYQEIGRAGRDGKPSRAVLLQSYADRRQHQWFFDRDYPEPDLLETLHSTLRREPEPKTSLFARVDLEPEAFDRVLEKLWIHGGARIDPEENVALGHDGWRDTYCAQREHRRESLEEIARYCESRSCRMLRLVRHFGDQADAGVRCGICDICAPATAVAQPCREANAEDRIALRSILDLLCNEAVPSTGKLHERVSEDTSSRLHTEELLSALFRAGFVHLEDQSFERDGRTIEYRRPVVSESGKLADESDLAALEIPIRKRSRKKTPKTAAPRRANRAGETRPGPPPEAALELVESLREFRLQEARRRRIPAFRIFSDRTLFAIAAERPRDEGELLAVPGIGNTLLRKYGESILAIVIEHDPTTT